MSVLVTDPLTYLLQVHRVLIPEIKLKHTLPRRSLVLFVDPDHEALIECVDGSKKYPPITSGEWKKRRLLETYNSQSEPNLGILSETFNQFGIKISEEDRYDKQQRKK